MAEEASGGKEGRSVSCATVAGGGFDNKLRSDAF